jgi:hypothetical protein
MSNTQMQSLGQGKNKKGKKMVTAVEVPDEVIDIRSFIEPTP